MVGTGNTEEFKLLENDIKEMGKTAEEVFTESARLRFYPAKWCMNLNLESWRNFELAATKALVLGNLINLFLKNFFNKIINKKKKR